MNSYSSFSSLLSVAAPSSLKRQASESIYNSTCSICLHVDAVIQTKECGHLFHTRCVSSWPMVHCPTCDALVSSVSIVNVNLDEKPAPRSGTWTKEEEDFVEAILSLFEDGAFPLVNGTPVRFILARLLNCTPMRLSKKFQKNPLGKQTYKASTEDPIEFNTRTDKMRHFSSLESTFRTRIALRRRYDSCNGSAEVEALSAAARQFWVQHFLTFAVSSGQSIEGIDVSGPKKKKHILKKLLARKYSQVINSLDLISLSECPSTPTQHRKKIFKKDSFDDAIFKLLGLDKSNEDAPHNWTGLLVDDFDTISHTSDKALVAWNELDLAQDYIILNKEI